MTIRLLLGALVALMIGAACNLTIEPVRKAAGGAIADGGGNPGDNVGGAEVLEGGAGGD